MHPPSLKDLIMSRIALPLLCSSFAFVLLSGCDAVEQVQQASNRAKMMNNLKDLGLAYHNCHDENNRGPQSWQEAEKYLSTPTSKDELVAAGYVVHWGIKIVDAKGGSSLFVLAYPPDAATNGGTVLKLDGSVQQMTAQEFNDALAQQKVDSPKAMAAAEAAGSGGGGAPAPAPADGTTPPGPPGAPGY
jgi:hypothetical protein